MVVAQFSKYMEDAFKDAYEKTFGSPELLRKACEKTEDTPSALLSVYVQIAGGSPHLQNVTGSTPEQILQSFAEICLKGNGSGRDFAQYLHKTVRSKSMEFGVREFFGTEKLLIVDNFKNGCAQLSPIVFIEGFKECFGYWPPMALCETFLKAVVDSFMPTGLKLSDEAVADAPIVLAMIERSRRSVTTP